MVSRLGEETPLVVDPQKLKWIPGILFDKKVSFTVKNSNEFDIVFKYQYYASTDLGNQTSEGVSETPHKGTASVGTSSFTFDAPFVGGYVDIQWLDENGEWQDAGKHGPF